MYEAKESERKILAEPPYNYNIEAIDLLDTESDKVRRGIPIALPNTIVVCKYQSDLQEIKKCQKKWWHFWA